MDEKKTAAEERKQDELERREREVGVSGYIVTYTYTHNRTPLIQPLHPFGVPLYTL